MRAVIYARFSSDNQRDESIDAQVRACTDYANSKGFQLIKVYEDKALTATSDRRPAFLRMIADAGFNNHGQLAGLLPFGGYL